MIDLNCLMWQILWGMFEHVSVDVFYELVLAFHTKIGRDRVLQAAPHRVKGASGRVWTLNVKAS